MLDAGVDAWSWSGRKADRYHVLDQPVVFLLILRRGVRLLLLGRPATWRRSTPAPHWSPWRGRKSAGGALWG